MTSIVALDLSTATGVAHDAPGGTRPLASTWRAPGSGVEDMGWRFADYERWLVEVLATLGPDMVAFEAPLVPGGKKNMITSADTVRLLIGLASITEMVAYRMGIEAVEANVQTVKAHFARGRATKDDMMAMARLLGWAPKNHNEADAMALWSYCKAIDDPQWAANGTPLFAGAAAEDNRGNDHAPTGSGQRPAR